MASVTFIPVTKAEDEAVRPNGLVIDSQCDNSEQDWIIATIGVAFFACQRNTRDF